MLGTELDLEFFIQPARALLLLEAENLLAKTPEENSPLRRPQKNNEETRKLVWDTRVLDTEPAGRRCIFIARKTERYDTHTRIAELLNAGHVVVGEWGPLNALHSAQNADADSEWLHDLLSHPNLICVTSSDQARNLLVHAASDLQMHSWTTLAITGTNGKTSTTQIAGTMLAELSQASVLRLGTLGIQVGSHVWENPFPTQPDFPGLLAASRMAHKYFSCTQLVMEATSIGIVEGRLGHWPVNCAAFLNLTQDHLDYHGTMDRYLDAKLDLFRNHLNSNGHVIVNCNDQHWRSVIKASNGKNRFCVGFGTATQRDAFLVEAQSQYAGIRFLEMSHERSSVNGIAGQWTLWIDKSTSVAQCHYAATLLGKVQHENLTAGAAMMIALGYPLNQIAGICSAVRAISGRLELVETQSQAHKPTVLVDYAHSPDALEKTLQTCRSLVPDHGKLVCIFGCGGDRDPIKRPQMGAIAARLADKVWVTSDNPRTEDPQRIIDDIIKGINPEACQHVTQQVDRKQAIWEAIQNSKVGDIVLIAGKGHEDYQIIGTAKHPFSDSETARQALNSKSNI